MKLIDADHFFEVLKENDLEFMEQADLMDSLKDLLDREPEVKPVLKNDLADYLKKGLTDCLNDLLSSDNMKKLLLEETED